MGGGGGGVNTLHALCSNWAAKRGGTTGMSVCLQRLHHMMQHADNPTALSIVLLIMNTRYVLCYLVPIRRWVAHYNVLLLLWSDFVPWTRPRNGSVLYIGL